MNGLAWLRARRVAAIRAAARAEPAIPAAQAYRIQPANPAGYTAQQVAENRAAAVERFRETAAAGGTVADQLAAVRAMDVWANDPYRCGCYPRYIGGCYCTRRHQ